MEKRSDNLPGNCSGLSSQTSAAGTDNDNQLAKDRVTNYLRALRVPEQEASVLATEALRRSEKEQGMHPIAAAMRSLRAVLGEYKSAAGYDVQSGEQNLFDSADVWARGIGSMPPLHRHSMLPVEIDRKPWWTFFIKRILRKQQ